MSTILTRKGRGSNKYKVFFTSCMVMLCLGITNGAWAALNDVAIYRPKIQGGMSIDDQTTTATYIRNNIAPASKVIYAGYDQKSINSLAGWMNAHMNDGQSDLLIIIDIIPAALFQGETEGSLAEQWMDNGNMLLWTGSEPFANYVDTGGTVSDINAGADGASKVLDVLSPGLCRGGGLQKGTSAVFYQYHDELGALQTDSDGDYGISAFVEYTAQNALNYSQLLIDANDSDWHHMSNWKVDEVFAEDSESYQSDNIVLVNGNGGQFAQFYTTIDLNDERKQVITQVINNWVALPCNTLTVDDDFVNPGTNEFTTIQAAVDAALPRDTILVKPGHYNEQLDLNTNTFLGTRGIKIVSDTADGGNEFLDPGSPDDVTLMNSNVEVCSQGEDPADIAQWKQEWSDGRPGYSESYAVAGVESKKVLRRAARTIIYGTGKPGGTAGKPMVDFALGSTIGTILDGFTVCAMPRVDHTSPGHAHVVQTRGGSATVVNNIVYNNGSSGLGSHAWFYDQDNTIENRDFRYANIMHDAHPVLINNVVFRNEGTNLGNNHYSYALMYNNELFESISEGYHESPGIGCQHGAHPLIDGNLVYKSAWVGIGGRKGEEQGTYPVNRPTHPIVRNNTVFDAGENDSSEGKPAGYPFSGAHGAGIGGDDTGGWDPKTNEFKYHIIENNYVNGAKNAAIGVRSIDPAYGELPPDAGDYPPDLGYVRIINNEATGGGTIDQGNMGAGIGLNGAHAVEISDNNTHDNNDAGIGIRGGGSADLIADNESYGNGMAGIGLKEGAVVGMITGNNLYGNAKAGIGHEGFSGRVSVIHESNNTIANNGMAGIGIQAADVGEISYNTIVNNAYPGITVISGTTVELIDQNLLDHNGTAGTTGLAVQGSSAVIENTTISNSGTTNISISDSTVTLRNCTIENSSAPNIVVNTGSNVTVEDSLIDTTLTAPNIHIADSDTVFTLIGSTVTNSAKPGLVTAGNPNLIIHDTVFDNNGTHGTAHLNISSCTSLDFDNVTVSNSYRWNIISNCNGSITNSEFHDIKTYAWGSKRGGMAWITNSSLDIINNVFHDPGFFVDFLHVEDSTVNVYHNTFVGRASSWPGPWTYGPAWGLIVLGTSTADVRNNIFFRLPNGLSFGEGVTGTASTNCFKFIYMEGIYGDNIIEENPYLMSDFTLDYSSPLIDAGELIAGVNDDYNGYNGNAPDVGAKETP